MPREFRNIVVKELREIVRDPRLLLGMILVPVLMFPIMGAAARMGVAAVQEQSAHMKVGFADFDAADGNHAYADLLYAILARMNMTVENSTATTVDGAVAWAGANGLDTLLVLPGNFSEAIAANGTADVLVYQTLRNFGFGETTGISSVGAAISAFNEIILQERLGSASQTPAKVDARTVVRGEVLNMSPEVVLSAITLGSIMVPVMLALVLVFAIQLAATSVAMEKEQKTLEVLLTLPIRRVVILFGKLSGVIVASLLSTVAIMISMNYYMGSFQFGGAAPIDLSATPMAPEPTGYLLVATSLFLSLLAGLALAVLLAAYTKDVRSAQSLIGILFLPIFLPALILMFAPVEIMPAGLRAVIYAIPFSYPVIASKALYTKEYLPVVLGIAYQVAFTAVVMWIASRFFASEKLLTARFAFGKKRKMAPQD